jgi:hypothetical protein
MFQSTELFMRYRIAVAIAEDTYTDPTKVQMVTVYRHTNITSVGYSGFHNVFRSRGPREAEVTPSTVQKLRKLKAECNCVKRTVLNFV